MPFLFPFFFFTDTATTEIYTLSLHDALPICSSSGAFNVMDQTIRMMVTMIAARNSTRNKNGQTRSEEHTSELQSQFHLVCRLLLEKKKKTQIQNKHETTKNKQ